jgi:co-chaperonin GroES (HSP10)
MLRLPKNKIACVPLFDPDMTPSGLIHIPDIAKERCDQGIVKYMGPECEGDLRPGDHVLFSGYTGTLISVEGEGILIILPESFVTAVIAEPEEDFDIPGLYFKAGTDEFWTATYEIAIDLIARGVNESKWFRELNRSAMSKGKKGWVTSEKPKAKEYKEWH